MFLHNFKYEFLNTIRQKDNIFWLLVFPIILGTFFNLAFGNLYEAEEMFSEISVAVVETKTDENFKTVMNQLSEGDSPLFKVQYTDNEKARTLLETNEIRGIIYVGGKITLSVTGTGTEQTIIKSFLQQYETQKTIITDIAMTNPAAIQSVIDNLSAEISVNEDIKLSDNKLDPYAQYFYNLIAMVALLGTTSGLFISITNQGNLSQIGARKCISPTPKLKSTIASLLASYLVHMFCVFVSITFVIFILGKNMGNNIGIIYLSGAVSALTGLSLGFLLGSIGRMSQGVKLAICTGGSMFLCFLSGLMVGNMKAVVNSFCPLINKINPAAVMSDLFFCLSAFDDNARYMENLITLLIMSVIFIAGGFLLIRRKKYASI